MRLNRSTIILLLISIVVIAAVLLLNNQPSAETASVTPTLAASGPLVTELTAEDVMRLRVTDNATEGFTEISREDAESDWVITVPEGSEQDREPDQGLANTAVDNLLALNAETGFAAESLAEFGLDEPAFTIEAGNAETTVTLYVGGKNPAGTRYYVQKDGDSATVYLAQTGSVEPLTKLASIPPYEPLPTPTATFTPTLNPLSEVEQATATAEMNATATAVMATIMAEVTEEATEEATAEATAAP